jgi:hypothetical protein
LPLAWGVGGDAVGDAQGGEGALELGVGVQTVGGGTMAEEGEAIGVERGGRAVVFEGGAQVGEVGPGGVAGHKGGGDDFAGVIVGGEEEGGIGVGGPPGMGRSVMLPEFADGRALPAAAGFGAGPLRGDALREVRPDVRGDGGAGAEEVKAAGQFIGQEGEVERLAVRKAFRQEVVSGLGPRGLMVAAGRLWLKGPLVVQPLMAQLVEPGRGELESLGGGEGVELAVVEGGQDFLNVERRDAVG